MKKLIVLILLTSVTSCTTMEFTNGPKMQDTIVHEVWHHQGLNGLIEFSKPLDVNHQCGDKQWDSVTIEQTVFNNLAGFSYPYITLYSPWTIIYECRDAID